MNQSPLFLQHIDHISNRVSGCAVTGLFVGASYSTLQGLPLAPTSISMATSFALVSTACFIPERIVYMSSFYFVPKAYGKEGGEEDLSLERRTREETRVYISHGLGGVIGGGITGSIFKGKPLQGMLLLSPIMMFAAYGELWLQDYKRKRIKELKMSS